MATRALIIGGGIAGCSVALELRRRGMEVTVVDRDQPGSGATGASAGMLAPQYESYEPDAAFWFGLESMELWPGFARELERLTDWPIGHRTTGMLVANRTGQETEAALRSLDWQKDAGLAGEIVPPKRARRYHPGVGTEVESYVWLPREALVDSQRLAVALADAVRGAGGKVLAGRTVRGIRIERGRTVGILLGEGTKLDGDTVVVAAGAWSRQLDGLPETLPVRPVRGQMLRFLPPSPPPWTLLGDHAGRYLVARENGTILAGSTMEDAGFDDTVTDEGRASIIASVLDLFPGLEGARLVERWAGLRPISTDSVPVLGPDPALEGLFHATGYGRNGILFAPLAARVLADLMVHDRWAEALTAFSVERFRTEA